ncbi:MAG: hypothetical protein CMQ60_00110 [Gammaproteobacteria bacterium]|nr:hypothetical protein [Gammaproteobacteria bacterium]|tara:strand:- start:21 stop:1133 length:1113 start_codon:yes stop_codon:yes gene_type:complete
MINVFEPDVSLRHYFQIYKALKQKQLSGSSTIVKEFERNISSYFDRKFCVSVSNGSSALDLALNCIDFKEGDEVVVPSFTIISCLSSIVRSGATPVFCDVDIKSWNMTLSNLMEAITDKTKAVLMVHTYGLTAEAELISEFCHNKGLVLIEDSAEAHGQTIGDKKCGSFGDISTLSFYANKHVTTGEGGAVLTDNEIYFKKLKQMKNLDFISNKRFQHNNFYWNYRMGGLQAAFGIQSLKNIDFTIQHKINQASYYNILFSEYEKYLKIPVVEIDKIKNHYWVYGIVLDDFFDRDRITDSLYDKGIETRPFFWPLHDQPAYKSMFKKRFKLPNSEYLGKQGFYIPLGKHLNKTKQKFVASSVISELNLNS